MALLQYDFRAVGVANVERAIAGIERRAIASMNRMARATGAPSARAGGPYRSSGRASLAKEKDFNSHMMKARTAAITKQHSQELAAERAFQREKVRLAKKAARDAERAEAAAARKSLRNRRAFARGTVGVAGRSVSGLASGVGALGGSLLAIGGGFAVANAIGSEKRLRSASRSLANQAFNTPGEKRSREQIAKDVDALARSEGIRSGLGRENIVGGIRQMVSISGNMKAAERMAPFMADIANATDADIGDVGRTSGQVLQSLGTKYDLSKEDQLNSALKETEEIMAALGGQAKVGSIEFKDMASQVGKLMSATAGFDGKASDLAKTMGAVSQIAIAGGASSPEEAMTSIMRFRDDLIQNQARFKKAGGPGGVNVFADKEKTRLRNPEEILFDMLKATGGSLPKVSKLFGIRAAKAVQPFQAAYTAAGGGEKGFAEVRRLLDSVKGATMSRDEIRTSAAFKVGGEDRQFDIAMEKFNDAMGKELLPTVTKLVPEFVKLIPAMVKAAEGVTKFVNALMEKPISTIGAVIAAKLVADLAAAGIGAKVSAKLIELMASSKIPIPGATPTPTPGGAVPVPGGGKPASFLGRLGAVASAAGPVGLMAGAILGLGHYAASAADEWTGADTKIQDMLPGMNKKGEFSLTQLAKDQVPGLGGWESASRVHKGIAGFSAEMNQQAPTLDKGLGKAGNDLSGAASKLAAAADKLSEASLNRGDKPKVPVKG